MQKEDRGAGAGACDYRPHARIGRKQQQQRNTLTIHQRKNTKKNKKNTKKKHKKSKKKLDFWNIVWYNNVTVSSIARTGHSF
jgi:hypothetical protein